MTSRSDLEKLLAKPRKKKYRNKVVRTPNGERYDSKAEFQLFRWFELMEKQKMYSDIRRQVQIKLTDAKILYIVDFLVFSHEKGCDVYAEMKGFETSDWRIKKRLWAYYGPGPLHIYKPGSDGWPVLSEELNPRQLER